MKHWTLLFEIMWTTEKLWLMSSKLQTQWDTPGSFHENVTLKNGQNKMVFDRLWYPLSILLLAAIGAKLIGPHGDLQVDKRTVCQVTGSVESPTNTTPARRPYPSFVVSTNHCCRRCVGVVSPVGCSFMCADAN